jgi:hypothetical protein
MLLTHPLSQFLLEPLIEKNWIIDSLIIVHDILRECLAGLFLRGSYKGAEFWRSHNQNDSTPPFYGEKQFLNSFSKGGN